MGIEQIPASPAARLIRNPHLWFIVFFYLVIALLHYPGIIATGLDDFYPALGLTRHTLERTLMLLPVAYTNFRFGARAGIASLVAAVLLMLPRAVWLSPAPADALLETGGITLTGALICAWFHAEKRRNSQSHAAQEAMSKMINGLPVAAFAINQQHKVTHWNRALESLSGIKAREVIGTDGQWRSFYTEKRRVMADLIVDGAPPGEVASFYRDKFRHSVLIDGAYEAEDFFAALQPAGKWLRFTASPVKDAGGVVVGAIETLEDITARREAEAALQKSEKSFRDLFEGAFDAIWVANLEGDVVTANQACARLSGYKLPELLTLKYSDLLSAESNALVAAERKRLLAGELSGSKIEVILVRKDGSQAFVELATSLVLSNGKPAFQSIARDVTEEKRLYENLRYYLREITRAQEEERKRIARELHDSTAQNLIALIHELENLLNEKTELPMREAKVLWGFYERIREILQEVRRFSRDLRPSILDDLGLLSALEWLTSELRNKYGIAASLTVSGSERRLFPEAELLLFRVVQEALSNIAKHANASSAQVKVEFDARRVAVTISDNGVGCQLPEKLDDLPHSGKLGLAGIQERVQLLGGTLRLESTPGKGTTVHIEAPI